MYSARTVVILWSALDNVRDVYVFPMQASILKCSVEHLPSSTAEDPARSLLVTTRCLP